MDEKPQSQDAIEEKVNAEVAPACNAGQPLLGPQQIQMTPVPQTVQPVPAGVPGQPGQVQWMAAPAQIPGVPPGLEYLTQIDQILVHQQVEVLEAVSGWEMCNKYQIKNSLGQQVYFAAEESGACMRQCCGPSRGFIMHIVNNYSQTLHSWCINYCNGLSAKDNDGQSTSNGNDVQDEFWIGPQLV